jgi:putative transposase
MRAKIEADSEAAEKAVRDIRRATRRHFAAEDKVRIVIAGLRGEDSVAELCRKEGINQNLYYRWSKEFLEAGKKRLAGDTAWEATSDEVNDLRAERGQLKELLADLLLEDRLLKKAYWGMGSPIHEVPGGGQARDHPTDRAVLTPGAAHPGPARHPALHLLSLVRLLSRRQDAGLADRSPAPRRVWNKLPAAINQALLELAIKQPDLSPRELATSFVDQWRYFVSGASVYRLLKAHDLITSPAFILLKAADRFADPITAPKQLWQTDFTYLRVVGWGWPYACANSSGQAMASGGG